MTPIEYLDRPPAGWFVLSVVKQRGGDWIALMINTDPDDFHAWRGPTRECWVRIPGKHRSGDAACDALEASIATRH